MIELYNEDCYKKIKEISDNSIDLVVIDPPYEIYAGGSGGVFGANKRNYHNEYIELCKLDKPFKETERIRVSSNADKLRENIRTLSKGIDISILDDLCRVLKKKNIYIWCNKNQLRQYLDYFEDKGCNIDVLVWCKTNPIPTCNNTYLSDVEYCILAREKGCKIYGNYHTKHKYYVSKCNVEDKKKYKHPTIKPLEIIKNLIINSSKEGDTVLDCFMGSGTTGVACKELNRNFIGIEIDEKYFNIAKERIEGIGEQDNLWK